MFFLRQLLLPALLLLSSTVCIAQKKRDHSLLWKISGNGLSRPSYLWGTIHIKDRRVFHFTDSMYHFLEQAEAYAMEIDPHAAMAAMTRFVAEEDTSALLKSAVSAEEFQKLAPVLSGKLKTPAERITLKQVYLYAQGIRRAPVRADDMPEPMDTYLYSIARNLGKELLGIEDVADQFDPARSLRTSLDIDDLLGKSKSDFKGIEVMVQIYLAQDLTQIARITGDNDSTGSQRSFIRRNQKMAFRIDSLARLRPTFFTVGAAHLPNARGVLALLEARGFTVTPVAGGRKLPPESYKVSNKPRNWLSVQSEQGSASVEMPGAAERMKVDGSRFSAQFFVDVHTGISYFLMPFDLPPGISPDSASVNAIRSIARKQKIIRPLSVVRYKDRQGWECQTLQNGNYLRIQGFANGRELTLLMCAAERQTLLGSADAERFFQSLQLMRPAPAVPQPGRPWIAFRDTVRAYAIQFPHPPVPNEAFVQALAGRADLDNWSFSNHSAIDTAAGAFYLMIARETKPGYYITNARNMLSEAVELLEKNERLTVYRTDTGRIAGYPALWLNARMSESGLILRTLQLVRGNRSYTLVVGTNELLDDSLAADRFFNSLTFLPYKEMPWTRHADVGGRFSTTAPMPFGPFDEAVELDHGNRLRRAITVDSFRQQSLYVDLRPLSPWRRSISDSAFFDAHSLFYRDQSDSLISVRSVRNGGLNGYEYLVWSGSDQPLLRLRLLASGDSLLAIYTMAEAHLARDARTDAFFESFGMLRPDSFRRDRGSAQELLSALRSTDTLLREAAVAALPAYLFGPSDLPVLYEALLDPYHDFDSSYTTVHDRILEAVETYGDSSYVSFVQSRYPGLQGDKARIRIPLLYLLAKQKTAASYTLIRDLLRAELPPGGFTNRLAYALRDALALTRGLFPDVCGLFADSTAATWLLPVLNDLLDSGMLRLPELPSCQALLAVQVQRQAEAYLKGGDLSGQIITYLGHWKQPQSDQLLRRMLTRSGEEQLPLALALIDHGQSPSPQVLQSLAASKEFRYPLHEALSERRKLALFPAAWRTQKALAESQLCNEAYEEERASRLVFVGLRERMFQGRRQRFYLFRMHYQDDERVYLGIAGPYALNNQIPSGGQVMAVLAADAYDSRTLDRQLDQFLEGLEKKQ